MITNTITIPPSFPPTKWAPSPSPTTSDTVAPPQQPKQTIVFTPPLIAMVVVIAAAFLLITYSRLITRYLHLTRRRITRWRNRNRQFLPSTSGDDSFYDSPFATTTDGYHPYSPFGLDDSFIKNIPLTIYDASIDSVFECAVCLVDFESGNCMRTLPVCSHAFHVECIDTWLKSHANCPICRAHVVVKQESPFVPLMCSRIRPSFDEYDVVLEQEVNTVLSEMVRTNGDEIQVQQELSSMRELKRSYSFDFERMELPTTSASPWRYRRSSFWSKRNSPFGMLSKPRVFSFRGMKSPFFRRRGFFPMSEGGGVSRRRRSVTAAGFSSSRMRCGDPEALLSPERFNGR